MKKLMLPILLLTAVQPLCAMEGSSANNSENEKWEYDPNQPSLTDLPEEKLFDIVQLIHDEIAHQLNKLWGLRHEPVFEAVHMDLEGKSDFEQLICLKQLAAFHNQAILKNIANIKRSLLQSLSITCSTFNRITLDDTLLKTITQADEFESSKVAHLALLATPSAKKLLLTPKYKKHWASAFLKLLFIDNTIGIKTLLELGLDPNSRIACLPSDAHELCCLTSLMNQKEAIHSYSPNSIYSSLKTVDLKDISEMYETFPKNSLMKHALVHFRFDIAKQLLQHETHIIDPHETHIIDPSEYPYCYGTFIPGFSTLMRSSLSIYLLSSASSVQHILAAGPKLSSEHQAIAIKIKKEIEEFLLYVIPRLPSEDLTDALNSVESFDNTQEAKESIKKAISEELEKRNTANNEKSSMN